MSAPHEPVKVSFQKTVKVSMETLERLNLAVPRIGREFRRLAACCPSLEPFPKLTRDVVITCALDCLDGELERIAEDRAARKGAAP